MMTKRTKLHFSAKNGAALRNTKEIETRLIILARIRGDILRPKTICRKFRQGSLCAIEKLLSDIARLKNNESLNVKFHVRKDAASQIGAGRYASGCRELFKCSTQTPVSTFIFRSSTDIRSTLEVET